MKRDTRLQDILTYLLIYLFISTALTIERPSMFPRSGAPIGTNAHSRALLRISFEVPSKEVRPPGPTHGVPTERDAPFLEPSFIHHSMSPVYESPSRFQVFLGRKRPPTERDARIRSLYKNIFQCPQ
jgi:hypothetical protein